MLGARAFVTSLMTASLIGGQPMTEFQLQMCHPQGPQRGRKKLRDSPSNVKAMTLCGSRDF